MKRTPSTTQCTWRIALPRGSKSVTACTITPPTIPPGRSASRASGDDDDLYPHDVIVRGLLDLRRLGDPSHEDSKSYDPQNEWNLRQDLVRAMKALPLPQRQAVYYLVVRGFTEKKTARRFKVSRIILHERMRRGVLNIHAFLNGRSMLPSRGESGVKRHGA